MRSFNLVFIVILSLVFFQCEHEESEPDMYLTATIDGKEYHAEWFKAKKYTDSDGRKWLEIKSATVNPEQLNSNSDCETISFSLIDNCLKPGTYNYEFVLNESGMNTIVYPFLYLYQFNNLNDNKVYAYTGTNMKVVVEQIEYL